VPARAATLPSGGGGYTKTTLQQKLPFLATGLFIVLIAVHVFRYARRLGRRDA
jgi:hypothetical protein